ncbi:hypothetical protein P5V15_001361 [Pogonomyrmex californicus]
MRIKIRILKPSKMLLMWGRAGQATPDSQHTLDWELFSHQPGIYYEEIGQLRQAESAWRLTPAIARLHGGNRNTMPKSNRQRPVRLPKHYEDNRKKKHQTDHAVDTSRNAIQND